MNHLVAGVIAVGLGIAGLIVWWPTFGMVMRGVVPFCLVIGGLIAMLSGWKRMVESPGKEPRADERPRKERAAE